MRQGLVSDSSKGFSGFPSAQCGGSELISDRPCSTSPDDLTEPIPRPPSHYDDYEQHFADNFGQDGLAFADEFEDLVVGRNVPGAGASTLRIHSLWKSCCRLIFKSGGGFSSFLWCMINKPGPTKPSPTAHCWPMPLPFFHCFRKYDNSAVDQDKAFKVAIALQVAFLNWLHLGKPGLAPSEICGFCLLSSEQEKVVKRLGELAGAWNDHPEIKASDLGRTAAKQESIEQVLSKVSKVAEDNVSALGGYSKRKTSLQPSLRNPMHAHLIGRLSQSNITGAQEIIASRIKMAGTPTFDPVPFLDEEVCDLYQFPLKHASDPSVAPMPPRVRVHAKFSEKVALLKLLESSGRLQFRSIKEVVSGYGNGLFTVPKDLACDRLILDARPANCLQTAPQKYIMSMGSAASLTHIILPEHQKLLFSGDDLSNFFYTFMASQERVTRNFLDWQIPVDVVRQMASFPKHLAGERFVYACLGSLAMGDSAACEYAQASHLSLGLQAGAFEASNLVTLHGRIPRGRFLCGIVIDDLVLMEKVALNSSIGENLNSSRKTMLDMYQSVGLEAHPSKGFANLEKTSFWGADVDGVRGLVRASVARSISLVWTTVQILKLGFTSISLLEILCGGYVSLFIFRRRLMSMLDVSYRIQVGRDRRDVISIPGELASELWGLVLLAPLSVAELRAKCCPKVFAVDSSNWGDAVVESPIAQPIADELHRHGLSRGTWTRLLSPYKAFEREAGRLDPSDELPGDTVLVTEHLLWETAAKGLDFDLVWKRRAFRKRHINIGELRSFLKAEECGAIDGAPTRIPILSDSQVTLGAVVKGRSASPALNRELQKSIPVVLSKGLYSTGAYVRSADNPADDPTRGVEVRESRIELPDWWLAAEHGEFSELDRALSAVGLDDFSVGGLPNLHDLHPKPEVLAARHSKSRLTKMHVRVKAKLQLRAKLKQAGTVCPEVFEKVSVPWSVEANEALLSFPKSAFEFSDNFEWPPRKPGFLDLYSGKRGFARSCTALGVPWVLCIDILDGPFSDLLDRKVRAKLEFLVSAMVFLHVSGAIICASFSRAITPAVRDRSFPRGLPWVRGEMKQKLMDGNSHSDWLGHIIEMCLLRCIGFWVENPDSSHLWHQSIWRKLGACDFRKCYRLDFCRFNTPWRKRTRFFTDGNLSGVREICKGGHVHRVLRGRSTFHKMAWTKVAEPYPKGLCDTLAWSCCVRYGFSENISGLCCRSNHRRIGEAKNPGPRQPITNRDHDDLDGVHLVRPETKRMGSKHWDLFRQWAVVEIGAQAFRSALSIPELLGTLLAAYGKHWYGSGGSLLYLRHLLIHTQRILPYCKGRIQPAWEVVNKWEILQPVEHRRPLPLKLLEAMVACSLFWSWPRVACVLLMAFHGCCRPGEVLRSTRRDLVLPMDVASASECAVFLRINHPKSRMRGLGKIQHVKISHEGVSGFLQRQLGYLDGSDRVFPGTPGSFRRRWDLILKGLKIPVSVNLTPGSLRPGGTVELYRKGVGIHDILWALRLKHVETLQHYLQEVSTDLTLFDLPTDAKHTIEGMSVFLPLLLSPLEP